MNELEIAWASGLFEGEGTFSFQKYGVSLQVTSTDLDVIEKFQSIVGVGNIYSKKKRMPHHKDQWLWGVNKKSDVKMVIEMMLPHLGKRRTARAYEALEVCEYIDKSKTLEESHGTRRGYEVYKCKCDKCRNWARQKNRKYLASKK